MAWLSLLFYITVKYVAYAAWSIVGVRLLRASGLWLRTSLLFGFIRLLIGVGFGVAVFLVGGLMHLQAPANPLPIYVGVFAPIRLVEWSIMAFLIADGARTIQWTKLCVWMLGGIAVSHLADIPMFLLLHGGPGEMLPIGRFLC